MSPERSLEGNRERDEKVKKDILAAITFLATGLLFYVVHADGKADKHLSSGIDCGAAETVSLEQSAPQGDLPIVFDGGVSRDS
jgi:hypothetical protein